MCSQLRECRCVRYYMNFGCAMAVLKEVLLREGRAFNARDEAGAHVAIMLAQHTWSTCKIIMHAYVTVFAGRSLAECKGKAAGRRRTDSRGALGGVLLLGRSLEPGC